MKKLILAAGFALAATSAHAQYGNTFGYGTGSNSQSHSVQGYERSNGTYVQPYQATNPNSTQRDNYGTQGNYNPYTGQYGTHRADH